MNPNVLPSTSASQATPGMNTAESVVGVMEDPAAKLASSNSQQSITTLGGPQPHPHPHQALHHKPPILQQTSFFNSGGSSKTIDA